MFFYVFKIRTNTLEILSVKNRDGFIVDYCSEILSEMKVFEVCTFIVKEGRSRSVKKTINLSAPTVVRI